MISRDAVRYLRSVNRRHINQYICPFCSTRATVNSRRSYASASLPRKRSLIETAPSPTDDLPGFALGKGNVREYLKKWAQDQEKEKQLQGNEIIVSSNPRSSAPSSLFIRDVASLEEEKESASSAELEPSQENDLDSFGWEDREDFVGTQFVYFKPGDVYFVRTHAGPPQLAIHLGYVGRQSQLLLQNGRWAQTLTWEPTRCEIASNFATPQEVARIKKLLPSTVIKSSDELSDPTGLTAVGDVPPDLFQPFAARFRRLQTEYDTFRREYAGKFEKLHDQLAEETDYKSLNLECIAKDFLDFDYRAAPVGARMAFVERFALDPRFILRRTSKQEVEDAVIVLPKRVLEVRRTVTSWARDYQDAAARASAGKDVLPELRTNPLTQFIAKARRLISKSRQIRTFDEEFFPRPTFPDAQPVHDYVERKPTGEGFNENDKQILILIWDTYLRNPVQVAHQVQLQISVIALILRAVGAYPDRRLDANVALLFLKELGCKEPWAHVFENVVNVPIPWLGLNHQVKVAAQVEEKGMKQLFETIPSDSILPPDLVADVRKDWGDLEAFAVDPAATRVVDDAFSVEPSTEHPGCTWIHMHVAHPAAFIPHHHDVLARAELMGSGFYSSSFGVSGQNTPYLQYDLIDKLCISDKRPSPVITISTLLHTDGSVKDTQVTAGTLHNVLKIDNQVFASVFGDSMYLTGNQDEKNLYRLSVGSKHNNPSQPKNSERIFSKEVNDRIENSHKTIEQHISKFQLMDTLLRARFEARKKENPNHLRSPRDPSRLLTLNLEGSGDPFQSFERMMRSEHSYGEPSVELVRSKLAETTETYADYPEHLGVMYQLRVLSSESVGLWARQRSLPVIYTVVEPLPEYPLEALNRAGRHDRIGWPITGKSLTPSQQVFLNLKQQLATTSPLRNFMDLINQYQLTAYLRSQADHRNKTTKLRPNYPYSKKELMRFMGRGTSGDLTRIETANTKYWTMYALYTSYRDDPNFPKLFDVRMPATLMNFVSTSSVGRRLAYLHPWPLKVLVEDSEQGYEASALPSQYLPVKIVKVIPMRRELFVQAVGPASDEPNYPRNFTSDAP